MAQVLNFTGTNGLNTLFEIPFQTDSVKQVRCRLTLPVTPSFPSFLAYDSSMIGDVPLADFMARVERIPTPTRIEGWLRFSIDATGAVVASITRAYFSVSTSWFQYTSAGHLYPLIFYSRWMRSTSGFPVYETNVGVNGAYVRVLENPRLDKSVGGSLAFKWRS